MNMWNARDMISTFLPACRPKRMLAFLAYMGAASPYVADSGVFAWDGTTSMIAPCRRRAAIAAAGRVPTPGSARPAARPAA